MRYFDSYIVEVVRKMISDKKLYLSKLENKFAFQQVQKEITTLEQLVLPELLYKTSIIHSEQANYFISGYDTAIQFKCNGMLVYIPIDENYIERPIIGILNTRQLSNFGTIGAMQVTVNNMDANEAEPIPVNLPLNPLLP